MGKVYWHSNPHTSSDFEASQRTLRRCTAFHVGVSAPDDLNISTG